MVRRRMSCGSMEVMDFGQMNRCPILTCFAAREDFSQQVVVTILGKADIATAWQELREITYGSRGFKRLKLLGVLVLQHRIRDNTRCVCCLQLVEQARLMDLKLPFARLVLQIQASLGSPFDRHPSTLALVAAKHDFIQHLTKYYHI